MRSLLLICILALLSPHLAAQFQEKYLFSAITSRNGLISEETTGVQQDAMGFIWISTRDGLQRYDGRRFLSFRHRPGDSTSLPANHVKEIKVDDSGRVWIVTGENLTGYFDTRTLKFHGVSVDLSDDSLRYTAARLMIDDDSNVLLIVNGAGIFRYEPAQRKFLRKHLPFSYPTNWNPVSVTHHKARNAYWIACDSGLVKYDTKQQAMIFRGHNTHADPVVFAYANETNVSTLFIDKSDRYWLLSGTERNPSIFLTSVDVANGKRKAWEIFDLDRNEYQAIYNITEQQDGTVWLMGTNLLAKLPRGAISFERLPSNLPGQFSIHYEKVRHLIEDREKNLWICTNKGLYTFNPSGQVFHVVSNTRPGKPAIAFTQPVSGIIQTNTGDIIVSTLGDGLFRYDSSLNPLPPDFTCRINRPNENFISCMYQLSNGDIWRGYPYGYISITSLVDRSPRTIRDQAFNFGNILQITEDREGNVWLGTDNGRLVRWLKNEKRFTVVQQFRSGVKRIMADSRGWIWVCTAQNGLFRIKSSDGSIAQRYHAEDPGYRRLLSNEASDIIRYNDTLYIVGAGGLNFLNVTTDRITHPIHPDDLPSTTITNLARDPMGFIWITTQSGLASVNLAHNLVTTYDERDGAHTNSFSPGALLLMRDGRMAVGTLHDWMVFNPEHIARFIDKQAPDVTITRFAVMNRWLDLDSLSKLPTITLEHQQNSITIEFSTLTYHTSYGIFYKLENLDDDWQLSRAGDQAVYNYLPEGNYVFKAICRSVKGEQSRTIAELRIKVQPPFYKTWWFLGILIFAGIFLLYWLDKLRMQKLRATESIRTRIATSLTEDMSNSLSSINISSELAKTKIDHDTERTKEYIGQISDTSNRMVQAMYDMVWSINPKNDTMADTIDRMKVFAGEIESQCDLTVHFDSDEHVEALKLDMEHRYEILSVFKEAVTNAGKHAGGRHIKVSLRYKKGKLLMMIVDDGRGFIMDNATMLGRGISDMRRRAAAINASFYIESELNTGTVVKLEVPV